MILEKTVHDFGKGYSKIDSKIIEKGAEEDTLEGACCGGHRELADYMIEKGACELSLGLAGACEGGKRELVDYMIEKNLNFFKKRISIER